MAAEDRRANRVAEVHRAVRPGLGLAAAFALVACVVAAVPHDTGTWLPLHLFLVGSLLSAICAAALLLAVTWSAGPAPPLTPVRVQQGLLTVGAAGVAASRELDWGSAALGITGTAVAAALVITAVLLVGIRRHAVTDRFHPAIDAYVVALGLAVAGSGLGVARGSGHGDFRVRDAHLVVNLLGVVGLVIAATLPYMVATQVRAKMAPRASTTAIRAVTSTMAVASLLAAAGLWADVDALAAAGFVLYALGIAATAALCPKPTPKNLRWAGPRIPQLAAGLLWWLGCCVALAVRTAQGFDPSTDLVLGLVIGGYGQILAGSLAYLGPVLRGGGHQRLGAGFTLTRAWPGLVAANVAAVGAVGGWAPVMATGIVVWIADAAVRTALLIAPARG